MFASLSTINRYEPAFEMENSSVEQFEIIAIRDANIILKF